MAKFTVGPLSCSGSKPKPPEPIIEEERVIFQAQRTTGPGDSITGDITYNIAPINLGNCMNKESGVFTVTKPGIYAFSFSGQSRDKSSHTLVKKNGSSYFAIGDHNTTPENNISFNWLMELSAGDEIKLHVESGGTYLANSNHWLVFTGQLLMST